MQINYYNESNFFERILQIIDTYGIKNVNSFAKDYLGYHSSEKINRLKKKNTNPSFEIIRDISNKFESLNVRWLVTGKGSVMSSPQNNNNIMTDFGLSHAKNPINNRIPLVSALTIGDFNKPDFEFKETEIKDYYVIPRFKDHKIDFMLEVNESSMYPKYTSGDILACSILDEEHFIQWGKVYVVNTKKQGTLVKRLYPCNNGSKEAIECRSEDLQYPAFEVNCKDVTGLALVVGAIRLG